MHVLNADEEGRYGLFMDKISYCSYTESMKAVESLNVTEFDTIKPHSQAIGMAVGQVVLDKVLELTKDMEREQLIRYLTEVTFSHVVGVMNDCPEYRKKIQILGPLIEKLPF